MWRIKHRSNQRLSFLQRESWFGQAFCSLFLFAGLAVLYGLFFVGIPKIFRGPPEPFWHYFLLLLPLIVGGSFAWIGAWGVAGRRGIDFDHSTGRITEWSGYFVPIWRTTYDLMSFDRVVLEPAVKRGGTKTAHWEYPVAITGTAGKRVAMEIMTPEEAAVFAHEIAGFLGLKIAEGWRLDG